jgi:hypothetical protein
MCQEITVGSGEGGKRFRPATGPLLRNLMKAAIYLPKLLVRYLFKMITDNRKGGQRNMIRPYME